MRNKIISEKGVTDAGQILDRLRQNVIASLHQTGGELQTRDGMDIALCVYDKNNKTIEYAGANNPVYYVRNGEAEIIKGDKMPIAIYDDMKPFTSHTINVEKGDCFYIFSDGYADQFGGPKNKKFKYKPFREMLTEHSQKPMLDQKQILLDAFENWRGPNEQVDDIVVMGFRI